jgi:hypothetical protein
MAISGPDAIAGADSVEVKHGNSLDLLWFALGEWI